MIDASEIVDAFVAALRDIPELVAEMDDEPERISAYHDHYPKRSSLAMAMHQMPAPGLMVAWKGTGPGTFGTNDVWKHELTLYLRARFAGESDKPAYNRLFRLITKGIPVSAGVSMMQHTIHPDCYPMDAPAIQRATDAEGLDYFEVSVTFTEIGDA